MKRLLLIAILFATTILAQGQDTIWSPGRSSYMVDSPLFHGMGYTYEHPGNVILPQWNTINPEVRLNNRVISVGYLSFSPEDRAIGIRSDMGYTYLSMSCGNYYLPFGGYIKDHSKIGFGFIYKKVSLGVAYHTYGDVNEVQRLTKAALRPLSVEAGVRVFVYERFAAALRYDLLRHEGTVEFGIMLNKQ